MAAGAGTSVFTGHVVGAANRGCHLTVAAERDGRGLGCACGVGAAGRGVHGNIVLTPGDAVTMAKTVGICPL